MIERLHHVNFLVRDLAASAPAFATLLGTQVPPTERLEERGVALVRFRIGALWLVLVQPLDPDSVPARRLAERGEGVFLLSFTTDDLEGSVAELAERGLRALDQEARAGLDGWRIMELEPEPFAGVLIQLLEEKD